MADFFDRRDLSGVTAFSNPLALFEFGFEALEQTAHNDNSSAAAVLEVSFDGVNVHARLQGTGPSKVIAWDEHVRRRLWVRSTAGGPAGARYVEVLATTR